jgi:hypothetical protein
VIGVKSGKAKGLAQSLALSLERADVSDKSRNVHRRPRKLAEEKPADQGPFYGQISPS